MSYEEQEDLNIAFEYSEWDKLERISCPICGRSNWANDLPSEYFSKVKYSWKNGVPTDDYLCIDCINDDDENITILS